MGEYSTAKYGRIFSKYRIILPYYTVLKVIVCTTIFFTQNVTGQLTTASNDEKNIEMILLLSKMYQNLNHNETPTQALHPPSSAVMANRHYKTSKLAHGIYILFLPFHKKLKTVDLRTFRIMCHAQHAQWTYPIHHLSAHPEMYALSRPQKVWFPINNSEIVSLKTVHTTCIS